MILSMVNGVQFVFWPVFFWTGIVLFCFFLQKESFKESLRDVFNLKCFSKSRYKLRFFYSRMLEVEGDHRIQCTYNRQRAWAPQGLRDKTWLRGLNGEGNGNPLQYSCLENPKNRGTRRAAVTRVRHAWVTEPPPPKSF